MANGQWGECKNCKFFEVEPGVMADVSTMGLCIVSELEVHQLRVSGASGCSCFSGGEPAHAEGASAVPPQVSHPH